MKRDSSYRFLAGYDVAEDYLVRPDPVRGKPGPLPARNPERLPVLIKLWTRPQNTGEEDLEQIWRSEIRQLQRLAAVPRAEDLFVPLLTSGEDAEA